MMLACTAVISSSFTNWSVAGICGVRIGQGCGRSNVIVVVATPFPVQEVNAAADLHRWHLGAMGMLFWSVSSSPPLTLLMRESAAPTPPPTLSYTKVGLFGV
jgi:hypothetical protein